MTSTEHGGLDEGGLAALARSGGHWLAPGFGEAVLRALRRQWVLFAVAGLAWIVELGLGAFLWGQISGIRLPPAAWAPVWVWLLGGLTVAQTVGAWAWRRRMLRPRLVARRLAEVWRQAGFGPAIPEAASVEAAIRTVFVTDAVTWMVYQTIAIYGLVAMILLLRLWPLAAFAGAALCLLASAVPRRRRLVALIAALVAEGRGGATSQAEPSAGDLAKMR